MRGRRRQLGAAGQDEGMTSDYAPTPVEDFLDPDDPTLFPRLTPEQVEYLAESARRCHSHAGSSCSSTASARPRCTSSQRGPGHHRPRARGRPLLHPVQGGDLHRRYLHVHGRADARRRVRRRTDSLIALPPEDVRRVVATAPPSSATSSCARWSRAASGCRVAASAAAADRLAMVGRGVRGQGAAGAQPRSLHLARPRHRRGEPGLARRARHRGRRVPVLVRSDDVIRRATVTSVADELGPASAGGRTELRRGRARWRPGRAGRGGLRGLGGSQHAGGRTLGAGRSGRNERADRELPRLPHRPYRPRPHPTGDAPGAQVRRRDLQRPRGVSGVRARGRGLRESGSPTGSACAAGRWSWRRARTIADYRPRTQTIRGAWPYYAATHIEAQQCSAEDVVVVGGGNSAGQAAVKLADQPATSTSWRGEGSSRRCRATWSIRSRTSRYPRLVRDVRFGRSRATRSCSRSDLGGGPIAHPDLAVFAMIGASPRLEGLVDFVGQDDKGFVVTGEEARSPP